MKLYNTRTRQIELFKPLRDNEVRVYVCGLTPSAEAHLGHARSFLFFDLLRRYLEHRGYQVTYVQNVTDIDDRSIATARELGVSYRDIVDEHYAAFKDSMRKLDVREPDIEPYATKYIPQIQTLIRELVESDHAYTTRDGIYYRVNTFERYGELSHRNIEELEAGARIEIDEQKDDPLDFALWKLAKRGEPKWAFPPFGDGRPGWHIECSAMSRELLDPQGYGFDIHGGGADLIFPHHENEIAQSEPLMEQPPMANLWVHSGLLLFDNKKMSKSLGNFEPLTALLERHDPQAIRLLFLQTGYRKVMNFTDESIAAASTVLERLKKAYRFLKGVAGSAQTAEAAAEGIGRTGLIERVETALDDDMNTAVAFAEVLQVASTVETSVLPATHLDALRDFEYALRLLGIEPKPSWLEEPKAILAPDFVSKLVAALGPSAPLADTRGVYPERSRGARDDNSDTSAEKAIERVLQLRTEARSRKDWATSDRLRDALAACGVAIHDSKDGTTWAIGS